MAKMYQSGPTNPPRSIVALAQGLWRFDGQSPPGRARADDRLFDSGATIVNIHSGQSNQQKVIEFYGSQVLPRVRNPSVFSSRRDARD